MTKYRRGQDRNELLADVAEMYYLEEKTQADISRAIGMTRSAISRMLTEARQKGIIKITVQRPSAFDEELEVALVKRFNLLDAHVLYLRQEPDYNTLRRRLGWTAAQVLVDLLHAGMICGVTWGTTISATINALQVSSPIPITVVQLGGVLGSSSHAFNAQALVQMLASTLGGEGVYLYSPFLVENEETARSIMSIPTVQQTIAIGRQCDIVLLGIGTITDESFSTLYQGGHMTDDMLAELRAAGVVGDVSGHHFNENGDTPDLPFHKRLVAIGADDLRTIPVRFGVAGSPAKAKAILGSLRGGYVNQLVTDSITAQAILDLDDQDVMVWAGEQVASEQVAGEQVSKLAGGQVSG